MERRWSRRRFLRHGSLAAAGLVTLGVGGCIDVPSVGREPSPTAARPTPTPTPGRVAPAGGEPTPGPAQPGEPAKRLYGFSQQARHARVANASFGENPDPLELNQVVRELKAQNVSYIEIDSRLSDWLSDEQYAEDMETAKQFNKMAHEAGLPTVWYYPSLEVISPGGEKGPSFFKVYPTWAQLSIKGEPNRFFGGVVFWVDPGNESVWLSPNGPWREYYLKRVKLLAQTGADAVWPDVPIYFSHVPWCDHSEWGKAAFKADTGLDVPRDEDFSNPTWRRWIEWRHRNLNQFLLDIAAAGRSVNPDFETFVEVVTMDYNDATIIGLDGAYLRQAEGITHVWEVDVVSNDTSMRYAQEDDWLCLISMYKYARAASGKKPAWAFSYGYKEDDATLVMAEVLAAGCNPYEVKSPEKNVGVSPAMRTRVYNFVKTHSERLFDARSLATVALYHSSASRDFVKFTGGTGLLATTEKPPQAKEWWSTSQINSCYEKQWLGEYRGALKALVHNHIPFNALTSPGLSADDLQGYKVLVAPDLECVSDQEAGIIRDWVKAGGTLIITGPKPTGLNEFGDTRNNLALADALGFEQRDQNKRKTNSVGAGKVIFFRDLLAWNYLRETNAAEVQPLVDAIRTSADPFVTTDADRRVHLEARELNGETVLQFVNFIGVNGRWEPTPASFNVSVALPQGKQLKAVQAASYDNPTPDLQPVPATSKDGKAQFSLTVKQYALVVVSYT